MDKINTLYSFLVDNEIATEQEINLVTDIVGYSEETLNSIIYCRTAYHDIEQLFDCERDAYYFSNQIIQAFNLE